MPALKPNEAQCRNSCIQQLSHLVQILDEFVEAVMSRWPKTVLQFEDFQLQYAHTLLQRYKHQHLVFNDDIQVHACVCVCVCHACVSCMSVCAMHVCHACVSVCVCHACVEVF